MVSTISQLLLTGKCLAQCWDFRLKTRLKTNGTKLRTCLQTCGLCMAGARIARNGKPASSGILVWRALLFVRRVARSPASAAAMSGIVYAQRGNSETLLQCAVGRRRDSSWLRVVFAGHAGHHKVSKASDDDRVKLYIDLPGIYKCGGPNRHAFRYCISIKV